MWTTGAPSTGVDEHPATSAPALNTVIVHRVERIRYLLLRPVGAGGVGGPRRHESPRRHLAHADGLHPLLAFLLLLQQLALARDVAAVALRQHVLANRADVLAGNDFRSDRSLHRNLELLAWDEFLELAGHLVAVRGGSVFVHDRAERIDRLALAQDVDLDEIGFLVARLLVVKAGVSAGARLQRVEEVEDDFAQRHRVEQLPPPATQGMH